ncbi:MAG: potassium channel family protein [Ardenticatenaceae bacterium]
MSTDLNRQPRLLRSLRKRVQVKVDAVQQFQISVLFLLGWFILGIVGFIFIEEMTFIDAAYMTVITLTTVGFGEVVPLSPYGRLFTIILILLGVGTTAYAVQKAVAVILEESLWITLGEREMNRQLSKIKDHYIVCGYGRMGREITREFERHGAGFVVIDQDESLRPKLLDMHVPHVIGDATYDEVLLKAQIKKARGLLAVVNSDADNVLIVLSAKGLNPQIQVVARATNDEMENKLRRAGADNVISPYVIGGQRMAFALVRPAVNDFLNTVVYSEELDSEMGQLIIQKGSSLIGTTLRESQLRHRWGAIVVAIRSQEGRITISPDPNRKLRLGDTLIVVAPTENIQRLEEGWSMK